MDELTTCTECSGKGWQGTVPCVNCNTRGIVCSQLYSQKIIDFDKAKKFPDPSDNR